MKFVVTAMKRGGTWETIPVANSFHLLIKKITALLTDDEISAIKIEKYRNKKDPKARLGDWFW